MGEQYTFGKGGQQADAAEPHSFVENLLSKDKVAHLTDNGDASLLQRAVETSEQFHKVLQEAYDLLHPIVERINKLPADHRKELIASITDMNGPAYDSVRTHCV